MFNERIQQFILGAHQRVFPFPKGWMDAKGDDASTAIKQMLEADNPCLIGRFGSIETEAMMAYLYRDSNMSPWERFIRFASWDVRYQGWEAPLKNKLANNAGFFPVEEKSLDRFAELYLSLLPKIDILGSWIHAELLLQSRMPAVRRIPLSNLEPYLCPRPWSKALEGKRVLVIHPFTDSIEQQYAKRETLFENPDILPDFELRTLKAIQSSGGNPVPFADWFQALEHMQKEIDGIDFDVAIVGTGAYGLPLAAHIKGIGKKAVHMGGATQMLFGIYGQRWIHDPKRKRFINEHWARPLESEKTKNAPLIENGCYW